MPPDDSVRKLFEAWVSTDLKAQVIVFFHENPGVVETVEGLAKRLGADPEILRADLEDHLGLGILKTRQLGDKAVIVYDASRRKEIQDEILNRVNQQLDPQADGNGKEDDA